MITLHRISRHLTTRFYQMKDRPMAPMVYLRRRRVENALYRGRRFIAPMPHTSYKMVFDPRTFFAKIYVRGVYEPHVVRYLQRSVTKGMCCLDIGANVGFFTLLIASLTGETGRVVAFEPTLHTYEMLRENIALNKFGQVQAENIALFNRDGQLEFNEGPEGFEVYNSAGQITHPSASVTL